MWPHLTFIISQTIALNVTKLDEITDGETIMKYLVNLAMALILAGSSMTVVAKSKQVTLSTEIISALLSHGKSIDGFKLNQPPEVFANVTIPTSWQLIGTLSHGADSQVAYLLSQFNPHMQSQGWSLDSDWSSKANSVLHDYSNIADNRASASSTICCGATSIFFACLAVKSTIRTPFTNTTP
jgi:hypothetical protein